MTAKSDYGTVVNCLGGPAQIPVIRFLQSHWGVTRVDVITETAPERILAEGADGAARCL
ncbi:MAG: hypothetical protein GX591_12060 [Planctomycetes bacterium]|nr:hypothetical protein [Planctomycetota bacterium]